MREANLYESIWLQTIPRNAKRSWDYKNQQRHTWVGESVVMDAFQKKNTYMYILEIYI